MRPLICGFTKISKSKENFKDTGVLGWGWPISPNFRKTKETAIKAVNGCQCWAPDEVARVKKWKKSAKFHHSRWRFHCVQYRSYGQARFFLPVRKFTWFLRPSTAKRLVFLPSGRGEHSSILVSYEHRQGTSESHSPIYRSSPNDSPCTSNSTGSPDAASTSRSEQQGKRSYEKWSEEEKKLLVWLWADNFDYLESKDARKAWERIARELSAKCGTNKFSGMVQSL